MSSRRRQRGYAQPISNNGTQSSHSNHNCGELKNEGLVPVRSLKRKKSSSSVNVPGTSRPKGRNSESQRTENRAPTPSTSKTIHVGPSALRQSSNCVMAAMGRPPSLGSDFSVRVSSKKDKGMIEETSKTPRDTRRHGNVDETDRQHSNTVGRHFFTGPLAVAEHERMRKEIESLKETLHESRQISRLQAKQLEESRAEAIAAAIAMKDREIELVGAKAKSRKNEELLSTIENSVQCQICMDLPERPFALNPCGHVLCLSCLQEWFRKAPPALDDMDADPDELTDPQYVLMRSKTCPSCRAVVKHRPVPIFMVKSVVAAIKKTKSPHTSSPGSRRNDDYLDDNPWKGIFTSSEEEEADDDEGGDDDESQAGSDSDDLGGWYRHSHSAHFEPAVEEGNVTSESEMENEEDEEDENEDDNEDDDDDDDDVLYTQQRWAPPTVSIPDYHIEGDDFPNWRKLLQRGCSWDMLHNFDVSYSHGSGIVVTLRSLDHLYASDDEDGDNADDINMYRVFLGWNIALDLDDTDGENYIQEMLREIKDVPERWEVIPTPGMLFAIDARRLVVVDEAGEFDTTDSEAWFDDEEDL